MSAVLRVHGPPTTLATSGSTKQPTNQPTHGTSSIQICTLWRDRPPRLLRGDSTEHNDDAGVPGVSVQRDLGDRHLERSLLRSLQLQHDGYLRGRLGYTRRQLRADGQRH